MDGNRTFTVLIADDEAAIRNGLHGAVSWSDYDMTVVNVARDGMEAWEFIQSYPPDIVITDIRMPGMSGLDLIKKCRDHGLSIRFILLSGYDDFTYAQTAIRYGARAYVLKPLKIDELSAELENLKEELEKEASAPAAPSIPDSASLLELTQKTFFNQLIHNEFHHASEIRKRMNELNIILPDCPYFIAVFDIRQKTGNPSATLLSDACNLLLPQARSAHIWESDSSHITLLVPLCGTAGFQIIKDCLKALSSLPDVKVTVGIGPEKTTLPEAGISYGMALTALSYELYESGRQIYDQTVICTAPPSVSTNSIDTQPLADAIRKCDAAAIRTYCQSFFDSLFYVPMPPPGFIRGMSIYLVTDVQNALRRQTDEELNLFSELPYGRINQLATLRQIREWVISLFISYSQSFSQFLSCRRDHIITNAKQYIREHMSQKIQAEDVASKVNLSPSYFTIYFKSKTGINFRDYVLKSKMDHAMHLLKTADANISEISNAVGYDDYRSFYRAFKNHTGLTPSEYQARES